MSEPADPGPLVEVLGVDVSIPIHHGGRRTQLRAVRQVDLSINTGETVGLVGESGGGKSTLGRVVAGLRKPTSGRVLFDSVDLSGLTGRRLRAMRRRNQVVFQDPYSSLNPRMRAGDIIGEPLVVHHLGTGREQRRRVQELLALVELPGSAAERLPSEFSGGQRQRIGIARALAVQPDFLVLDEPISALDISVQAQILNLLLDLRDRMGLTYLFIAHDLVAVRHMSNRVAVLYLGSVVEIAPAADLYTRPEHPYTRALLSAQPMGARSSSSNRRERTILRGDLPSAIHPPTGCTFHPRCPLYRELGEPEICRSTEPRLATNAADARAAACHYAGAREPAAAPST